MLADGRVQRRCVFTELEHLAEQRDPAAGRDAAELVDRGAHRVGVRVVGVVDQDDPARECVTLAAQRRERDLELTVGNLDAGGPGRGDRAGEVPQLVALGEVRAQRQVPAQADDPQLTAALLETHVATVAERHCAQVAAQVRRKQLRAGRDDGGGVTA